MTVRNCDFRLLPGRASGSLRCKECRLDRVIELLLLLPPSQSRQTPDRRQGPDEARFINTHVGDGAEPKLGPGPGRAMRRRRIRQSQSGSDAARETAKRPEHAGSTGGEAGGALHGAHLAAGLFRGWRRMIGGRARWACSGTGNKARFGGALRCLAHPLRAAEVMASAASSSGRVSPCPFAVLRFCRSAISSAISVCLCDQRQPRVIF